MAARSTAQRLELVQNAIDALVTGAQSTTVFGRQYVRAQLSDLQALEKMLEAKLARESRGGMRVRLGRPL